MLMHSKNVSWKIKTLCQYLYKLSWWLCTAHWLTVACATCFFLLAVLSFLFFLLLETFFLSFLSFSYAYCALINWLLYITSYNEYNFLVSCFNFIHFKYWCYLFLWWIKYVCSQTITQNVTWKMEREKMQQVWNLHLFRNNKGHIINICTYLLFLYFFYLVLYELPSVLWQCWLGIGKSIQPVKKFSEEVLAWLSVCREVQMICIRSSKCYCPTFWCQLTQVVLEKRPLNGCQGVNVLFSIHSANYLPKTRPNKNVGRCPTWWPPCQI